MPQRYTDTWHRLEAADERAWLDQWARAMKTPEQPWARPDWGCAADLAAHIPTWSQPQRQALEFYGRKTASVARGPIGRT